MVLVTKKGSGGKFLVGEGISCIAAYEEVEASLLSSRTVEVLTLLGGKSLAQRLKYLGGVPPRYLHSMGHNPRFSKSGSRP